MKNVFSTFLFLMCSMAVFGQVDPPEILNHKSGKTVYEKTTLYFVYSNGIKDPRILVEISKSNKFNGSDDSLVVLDSVRWLALDYLQPGINYFIRSMILSDQGFSRWSNTFEIAASDTVKGYSSSTHFTSLPILKISWIYDYAKFYEVQFDTVPGFNSPALFTDTTSNTSYSFASQIRYSKIYHRVKPISGKVEGEWSSTRLFTGYAKPILRWPSGQNVYHSSVLRSGADNVPGREYRWQVATDSTFTALVIDTLSHRNASLGHKEFDTDYYTRVAFEDNRQRSAWTYGAKYSLQGPELRSFDLNRKLSRSVVFRSWFTTQNDTLEVEVSGDSLFKSSDMSYRGLYKDKVELISPFQEKEQFVRWRVYHKNDTSSWSAAMVVFRKNLEEPISLNGIAENGFANKLFAPNGNLSFDSYGADFKKVWVEIDTSKRFDSDKKVVLESEQADVEVPDLYMGQTYFIRYRVAYTSGYEEKDWSSRKLAFETLNELSYRVDYTNANYIVRDVQISPITDFNGSIQFQLFEGAIVSMDFLRLDTLVDGHVNDILLPFDTTTRYRARLVNKVDVSDWIVSSLKSYKKPKTTQPLDTRTVKSDSVSLEWRDTSYACTYIVQIDTQELQDFQQGIVIDAGRDFPRIGVASGKTYYWRIKARTRMGSSAWSNVSTFVTDNNNSVPSLPKGAVKVYPNPVFNQLTMVYNGASTVRLLNLQGQALRQVDANGSVELNMAALASGIYILEVNTADGVYRQQIEKL